jgi:hypothetical protein
MLMIGTRLTALDYRQNLVRAALTMPGAGAEFDLDVAGTGLALLHLAVVFSKVEARKFPLNGASYWLIRQKIKHVWSGNGQAPLALHHSGVAGVPAYGAFSFLILRAADAFAEAVVWNRHQGHSVMTIW